MTPRDLIRRALTGIGVLADGETPSASMQVDALQSLNDMLESWSLEGLNVYQVAREEFTLLSGTASYTIGPSGTFNTTRPVRIRRAAIEDQSASPTMEYPMDIVTPEQWAAIQVKDLTATIPFKLYYDPGYPLGTLNVYPNPTAANKLVLYSEKQLTALTSVGQTLAFPTGYTRALRFGLMLELAPEYGKQLDAAVIAHATESKANIKRLNIQVNALECDAGVLPRGRFNIFTGGYN